MLMENIGFVVKIVSISVAQQVLCACIAADMRMHNRWCACDGQLLCANYYSDLWHTLLRDAWRSCFSPWHLAVLRCNLRLLVFGIGEEWWRVGEESLQTLHPLRMPINTGVPKERWRVKVCSLADKKWGASCFQERNRLRPLILLLMSKWAP